MSADTGVITKVVLAMRIPIPCFTSTVICIMLLLSTPAWAVPLTGYLEGTAANGWQGDFAVQLTDGSVVTGVNQMMLVNSFSSLPLTIEGCAGCMSVTNLTTSTVFTMSGVILFPTVTSTLGSLGTVSWVTQPVWVLPGDPSPTVAVLAGVNGTLGGTTLTGSSLFGFNSTLTSTFISTGGGQALSSLRLDFTDGTEPLHSHTLAATVGCCWMNDGVPVALGTPLAVAPVPTVSVPEPSSLLLLGVGLLGLMAWHRRKMVALWGERFT